MYFEQVLYLIQQTEHLDLPGAKAHSLMMPLEVRQQIFKDVAHMEPPRKSAVLALLYPDKQNMARMVFILRKTYNGHHSGQIAFPGGKQEAFDTDLKQTALRETREEIGIASENIQIKRALSPVFIPISNYQVQPYLAITRQTPEFVMDPVEVAKILELPFAPILRHPLINIRHNYFGKTYDLKAFEVENVKIWGATAMILSEIVMLLNRVITD